MNPATSTIVVLFIFTMAFTPPLRSTNTEGLNGPVSMVHGNLKDIPFSLKQRRIRSVFSQAVISFAANDEAWLFLNHEEKGHLKDPNAVKVVVLDVKRGDVIALKVKGNGTRKGVAVNVEYEGINYPSNGERNGSWKAMKSTGTYTSWMLPLYSSCRWWRPTRTRDGVIEAVDFPYVKTGASYVWASSYGQGDINNIWMRLVVGEENCRSGSADSRKRVQLCDLSTPACQAIWGLIPGFTGGESSTDFDPEECKCRRTDGPLSKCYRMEREGSRFGRCRLELCGDKYECVEDGEESLLTCMKRTAKSLVVPHPVFKMYCKSKTLSEPNIFYVLEK